MTLFVFDPNDWGMRYFVMAENKVEAHLSLLAHFIKEIDDESYYKHCAIEALEIWKNVNPLDATTFPDKYELKEFGKGSVIEIEVS